MGRGWIALVAAAVLACGADPTFICETPDDCGAEGVCEPNGGCSFPDETCESGRRFARYTPSRNECVPVQDGTSSTSTSSAPITDTLEDASTSSTSGPGSSEGGASSSTTSSVLPETTGGVSSTSSSSSGAESSSGGMLAPDFYDDFERPDAAMIGNDWVEKTPDAFELVDGTILRVGPMLSYPNNLVYRPDEVWLDAETTLELFWFDTSESYGSPQVVLRTQLDDIDEPGSVTGYLLYVSGSSGALTITRQIAGEFTQEHVSPLVDEPVLGALYRLRLRVTGTDPVLLDGYLERQIAGEWVLDNEVHGIDDTPERIDVPGTLALSGHQELELWAYESVALSSLD